MRSKIRGNIFRVACFIALTLVASVFGLSRVFANTAPFEISNVVISQKSATTTGNVTGFSGNKINNNITFRQVGDSVTYKITLKNVSDKTHIIDNVSSDYQGELFAYEFNSYVTDEVNPGDTFDFVLKTTYKKAVSDVSNRNQNLEISFVFKFSDGSEMTIVIANPSTWDNISVFGVIFASCIIGLLALLVFRVRKMDPSKKVVMIGVLLAVACLPLPFVEAADGVYDLSIENAITLNDELVVKFMSEGGVEELASDTIEYNSLASAMTAPEKTGYAFTAWTTEDGTAFDFTQPVTKDTTLYANYSPYVYFVQFDGNGATSGSMQDKLIAYDEEVALTKNAYKRDGYDFTVWKDNSGRSFADEELVKNLMSTNGDYPLTAQWVARNDTKYTVISKIEQLEGDGEYVTIPMTRTGTTDQPVTPAPASIDGYETPEAQTEIVKGDGSMVITYVYNLLRHQLTLEDASYIETTATSGEYKHGATVTLKAKERDGFKFDKWSNGDENEQITIAITDDMTIKPIYKEGFKLVFSHEGACTFNGNKSSNSGQNGLTDADYISGDDCDDYSDQKYIDTGVRLYSEENAHKDFLVEFSIDEFDLSKNGDRATLLNSTFENSSAAFPGVVVRRNDNQDKLMIGVNVVKDKKKTVDSKTYFQPISSVSKVRIMRKNDAICYAINDEAPVYVGDNSTHNYYFDAPSVMFGASLDYKTPSSPTLYRSFNGTLSGMKIRLGKDVDDTLNCEKP